MDSRGTFEGRGRRARLAALMLLGVAAGAGGCAKFSPDGGMLAVQAAAGTELGKDVVRIGDERDAAIVAARVKALKAKPLTAASAVQIALISNRGLQAAFNELGISEAQMVEASLPPSPTLAFQRVLGNGFEIERSIVQNVLALLTLPRRREIAEARFVQAQARAAEATLRTAMDAGRAYYRAVAANEAVKLLEESRTSAEAVSDLAKQLGETGAMSKLEQAREHVFYAELSAQLAAARLRQRSERERLTRALGLWGADASFKLPDELPALPPRVTALASVEKDAVSRRVDLVIARIEIDILAMQLGLTRRTRFINLLGAGGVTTSEKDVKVDNGSVEIDRIKRGGFEVEVQIPIYDFGEARVRLAEETYMQAVNRLQARAVNVRSEAREAYQTYRGAYDIARQYERDVLPLRKIISDETMLNYNAMMKDLFELLAEARARITANIRAVEARRDFWVASVDLHAAIVGGRGGESSEMPSVATASAGAEPAGGH